MEGPSFLTQNQIKFAVKYFTIQDDSFDPQNLGSNETEDSVYVQLEIELTRQLHDALTKTLKKKNVEEYKVAYAGDDGYDNYNRPSKKHLYLFNDKSASMWGKPFEALKQAQREVTDILYSNELTT